MSRIPIVQSARISPVSTVNGKTDFKAKLFSIKKRDPPYVKTIIIDNIFYAGGGAQYINKYLFGGSEILNLTFDALINSLDINRIELSLALTKPHIFNNRSYITDKITLGFYNVENSKKLLLRRT